jgi:uncharacterized protein with GYD domain
MALSLIHFSYNSETVGKLIQNPEDRSIAVKNLFEKFGGKLVGFYYCFGDYDGVVIADMPDNTSLLAAAMVAFAGGGTTKIKTTPLITVEEAIAAMKKGSGIKLQQPKG